MNVKQFLPEGLNWEPMNLLSYYYYSFQNSASRTTYYILHYEGVSISFLSGVHAAPAGVNNRSVRFYDGSERSAVTHLALALVSFLDVLPSTGLDVWSRLDV